MSIRTTTLFAATAAMLLLAAGQVFGAFNEAVESDARAMRKARQEAAEAYEYQKTADADARRERENTVRIRVAQPGTLPGPKWTASQEITLASEQYRQVEGRLRESHVTAYRQGKLDANGLVAAVLADAAAGEGASGQTGPRAPVAPAILLTILALACYLFYRHMDSMPITLRRIRTRRVERGKIYDVTRPS